MDEQETKIRTADKTETGLDASAQHAHASDAGVVVSDNTTVTFEESALFNANDDATLSTRIEPASPDGSCVSAGNQQYWFPAADEVTSTFDSTVHRVYRDSRDRKKALRDVNLYIDNAHADPLTYAYAGACIAKYMSSPTFGTMGAHHMLDSKRMQAFLTRLFDNRTKGFERKLSRMINRFTSTAAHVVFDGERPGASSYILLSPFSQLLGVDVDAAKATGGEAEAIAAPLVTSVAVQTLAEIILYALPHTEVKAFDGTQLSVESYDAELMKKVFKTVCTTFDFQSFAQALKDVIAGSNAQQGIANTAYKVIDGLVVMYTNIARYIPQQLEKWLGSAAPTASYSRSVFSYIQAALCELLTSCGVFLPFEGITKYYTLLVDDDRAPFKKDGLFDIVSNAKTTDYTAATDLAQLASLASVAYKTATRCYGAEIDVYAVGEDVVAIICRALRASYANARAKGQTLADLLKSNPEVDISYDYRGRLVERASQRVSQQYYDELTLRALLHGLTGILKDADTVIDSLIDSVEQLVSETGDLLTRLAATPSAQFPSEVENAWRKIVNKNPAIAAFFADSTVDSSRAYTLLLRAAFEYKVETGYEFAPSVVALIKRLSPLSSGVSMRVSDDSLDYLGLPSYFFCISESTPSSLDSDSGVAAAMRSFGTKKVNTSAEDLASSVGTAVTEALASLYVTESANRQSFVKTERQVMRRFCRFTLYDILCSQKKLIAVRQHVAGRIFSAYTSRWSSMQRAESGRRIDELQNVVGYLASLVSGARRQYALLILAEVCGLLRFVKDVDVEFVRGRYGLLLAQDDFTLQEKLRYIDELCTFLGDECSKYAFFDFEAQVAHYYDCFSASSFWDGQDLECARKTAAIVQSVCLDTIGAKRLTQVALLSKTSFENSASPDVANAPSIDYLLADGFASGISSDVRAADQFGFSNSAAVSASTEREAGGFSFDQTMIEDDVEACAQALRSALNIIPADPFGSKVKVFTVALDRLIPLLNQPTRRDKEVRRSDEIDECFYTSAARVIRRHDLEVVRFKPQIAGLPSDVLDDDADVLLRLARLVAWRSQVQHMHCSLRYAWVQQALSEHDLDAVLGIVGLSPNDTLRLTRAYQFASYLEMGRGYSAIESAADTIRAVTPLVVDWDRLESAKTSLRHDIRLCDFVKLDPQLVRRSGIFTSVLIKFADADFIDHSLECTVEKDSAYRTAYWFEEVNTVFGVITKSVDPSCLYLLSGFREADRRGLLNLDHYRVAVRKYLSQMSDYLIKQTSVRKWGMGAPIKPDSNLQRAGDVRTGDLDDNLLSTLTAGDGTAQSRLRTSLYV